jgi:hypothetical protein
MLRSSLEAGDLGSSFSAQRGKSCLVRDRDSFGKVLAFVQRLLDSKTFPLHGLKKRLRWSPSGAAWSFDVASRRPIHRLECGDHLHQSHSSMQNGRFKETRLRSDNPTEGLSKR